MPRKRLFTPGPVEVPQAALLAMARQVRHHRTPEFRGTMREVTEGLKYAFQTANDVLILSCSGSGGMEAAVVNSAPAEARRGAGIGQIRRTLAADRRAVRDRSRALWTARGEAFEAAEVGRLLQQHPEVMAVFSTLQETSTGVGHDIEAIGRVVRDSPALLVVDGISGVGAMECRTDAWGIDVLVVGARRR